MKITTYSSYNPNNLNLHIQYGADYVNKNKLVNVADGLKSNRDAIQSAKRFIEKHGAKGDEIHSVGGDIHRYTGKNWSIYKPSNM